MNYKPENRIPWQFTDFDNIRDFPWLFKKFPDFSPTLKNFRFSLASPWLWQPWSQYQTIPYTLFVSVVHFAVKPLGSTWVLNIFTPFLYGQWKNRSRKTVLDWLIQHAKEVQQIYAHRYTSGTYPWAWTQHHFLPLPRHQVWTWNFELACQTCHFSLFGKSLQTHHCHTYHL